MVRGPGVSDVTTTGRLCQEDAQYSQNSPTITSTASPPITSTASPPSTSTHSPTTTSTASNVRTLTHTTQNLLCECPRVALPHQPCPELVHVPAKHGLPVDSGGSAGGDCRLKGGDAYGTMSDSLSLPPPKIITKTS